MNTTGFLKQKGSIIKHLSIIDKVDTHSDEHVKQSLVEWDHNKAFLSHLLLELLLLTINNYANTTTKQLIIFFTLYNLTVLDDIIYWLDEQAKQAKRKK